MFSNVDAFYQSNNGFSHSTLPLLGRKYFPGKNSKLRLTDMVAVRATKENLSTFILRKSKTPKCFNVTQLPYQY